MKTLGEQTFEAYLHERGIVSEFERLFHGKKKRPDYTVTHENVEYLFEVKDFDLPKGLFDPHRPIRAKIDAARRKFQEFSNWTCALVLFNPGIPAVDIESPDIVLGAMYGNLGLAQPFDTSTGEISGDPYAKFLGGGKMNISRLGESSNSRISSLITLRRIPIGQLRLQKYAAQMKLHGTSRIERAAEKAARLCIEITEFDRSEERIGVIVWENAFAKRPLPRDLFNGEFDVIFGIDGSVQTRVFAGSGILALESSFIDD